jgi:hypothetical protein
MSNFIKSKEELEVLKEILIELKINNKQLEEITDEEKTESDIKD